MYRGQGVRGVHNAAHREPPFSGGHTHQHVGVVEELHTECGQLEHHLSVVGIHGPVLPRPVVVEVPQVNDVAEGEREQSTSIDLCPSSFQLLLPSLSLPPVPNDGVQ